MAFAFVCASLTTIMYISLVTRFSQKSLYYLNGYSVIVDVLFTVLVIGLSASTGTLTAMLISAFTGVMLSVSLILLKHYTGYTRIERVSGSWFKFKTVNYSPKGKLPDWLSWVHNFLPTVNQAYA